MFEDRKYIKGVFSTEEVEVLKSLFPDHNAVDIAARMNRSVSGVKKKMRELGLTRRNAKPWTKKEIAYLRKHYPTTTTSQIANAIDRNLSETKRKASELKLKKK